MTENVVYAVVVIAHIVVLYLLVRDDKW